MYLETQDFCRFDYCNILDIQNTAATKKNIQNNSSNSNAPLESVAKLSNVTVKMTSRIGESCADVCEEQGEWFVKNSISLTQSRG